MPSAPASLIVCRNSGVSVGCVTQDPVDVTVGQAGVSDGIVRRFDGKPDIREVLSLPDAGLADTDDRAALTRVEHRGKISIIVRLIKASGNLGAGTSSRSWPAWSLRSGRRGSTRSSLFVTSRRSCIDSPTPKLSRDWRSSGRPSRVSDSGQGDSRSGKLVGSRLLLISRHLA